MTKQEIIAAVVECTQALGHTPSHVELLKYASISRKTVRRHFANYGALLAECNLSGTGSGYKAQMEEVFRDWATLVRSLKKIPTISEYELQSRFSVRPLTTRFGVWSLVPYGLKQYAEEQGWAEEWKDVLAIVGAREEQEKAAGALKSVSKTDNIRRARRFALRQGTDCLPRATKCGDGTGPDYLNKQNGKHAIYGPVMRPSPLMCGPMNELGVVFLFGALAESLGFVVMKIQAEFPDCEALRLVDEERWQRVRIEFEYESRNFLKHMHELNECDVIVCWRHNWPECPLEVVELRKELPKLP
jgi:hypothetical protein